MKTGAKTEKRYADRLKSPMGDIWVVVNEAGALTLLEFDGGRSAPRNKTELVRSHAERNLDLVWSAAKLRSVARALDAYFAGKSKSLELRVAPEGTPFQRKVWRALGKIRYGQTISYGALATRVGVPGAARAVGRANATNPISLVIPCHRVIGSDGSLTGYGGGMQRKEALLELEGALP